MKVSVVIFPSKPLQDLANSYRKRYDPKYTLIPPHLTLKAAFDAEADQLPAIAEKLEEIANQHRPFQLRTAKISSFHPVNNVIYLKVDPEPELTALFAEIHNLGLGDPPPYAFVPHITIGQELSNDEHADVYSQLRLQQINHTETVDRFHLLYQLENGVWNVYETFLLRKR